MSALAPGDVIAHEPSWPEARFRITAANASPRAIHVVFLADHASERFFGGDALPDMPIRYSGPSDFVDAVGVAPSIGFDAIAADAQGVARLERWLGEPDLVFVVAEEGDDPALGVLVAHAYRARQISVSGFVQGVSGHRDSWTSDGLRPACSTMLIVNEAGYLSDLLGALGTHG
ncbi:MAG TPA: hypothetical protein VL424_02825 [Pararobbsia sp.]|nr:hypothetical protein [Pararobbsia sp.]